jgi:uncharacterized protein YacL
MSIEFVVRIVGGIILALTAYQVSTELVDIGRGSPYELVMIYAICSASFGIGCLIVPALTTRPFFWLRHRIYQATAAEVLATGVGLAFGVFVGALLAYPLSFLPGLFGRILPLAASVAFGYFGIMTLLIHKQSLVGIFGLAGRAGSDGSGSNNEGRTVLVDTSAIIDGRIADIGRTGFLGGKLVVPRFVLEEMQHIADSPDPIRRSRGRRGLEVLNRLQKEATCPVEISDVDVENAVGVDAKLVRLARTYSYGIMTTDYNLNHVAQLQGVEVLNVNQLANAVRSAVMQGEELSVRVIHEGKEMGQGVAYLDDGTMIVVEAGRNYVGTEVDVVVTKVLQTAAGRMIFARLKHNPTPDRPHNGRDQ